MTKEEYDRLLAQAYQEGADKAALDTARELGFDSVTAMRAALDRANALEASRKERDARELAQVQKTRDPRDISHNVLAVAKFQELCAAGDPEGAVIWARDHGFSVQSGLIPTPGLAYVEKLRREGKDAAIATAEATRGEQINAELRARALADELASGEKGPLVGRSAREKRDLLMSGKAGLTHVESVQALLDMGEESWARQYRSEHLSAYNLEVRTSELDQQRRDGKAGHEKKKAEALAAVRLKHTMGGALYETLEYKRDVAAIEHEFNKAWLAFEGTLEYEMEKHMFAMNASGGALLERGRDLARSRG